MTDESDAQSPAADEAQVYETVTDLVGSTARHVIRPLKKGGGKK